MTRTTAASRQSAKARVATPAKTVSGRGAAAHGPLDPVVELDGTGTDAADQLLGEPGRLSCEGRPHLRALDDLADRPAHLIAAEDLLGEPARMRARERVLDRAVECAARHQLRNHALDDLVPPADWTISSGSLVANARSIRRVSSGMSTSSAASASWSREARAATRAG